MTSATSQNKYNIDEVMALVAAIESGSYALEHMATKPRFPEKFQLLDFCAKETLKEGLVMEFGVFTGDTINFLAEKFADRTVYGFDSFEGLPEPWSGGQIGNFALDRIPVVKKNVELVTGWFDRSLPQFLDRIGEAPVAFLHIDCDLYSSTQTVLAQLKGRIRSGAVIVFDEYFNYPEWRKHEFKAFSEFVQTTGLRYDYIGLVPAREQVAVRIL